MEYAIITLVSLAAGYFLCYFTAKPKPQIIKPIENTQTKRIKPSMRSPLQTYTEYDKYKSKDGLYAAVKPKGGDE